MDVDYELAWLKLRAHVASKRSHGEDELTVVMAHIEVDCADPALRGVAAPSKREATPAEDALASPSGMPRKADPLATKEAADGSKRENGAAVHS